MLKKTKTLRQIEAEADDHANRLEDLSLQILLALISRRKSGPVPSSEEDFLPQKAVKMAKILISEINSIRAEYGQMLQRVNNLKLK